MGKGTSKQGWGEGHGDKIFWAFGGLRVSGVGIGKPLEASGASGLKVRRFETLAFRAISSCKQRDRSLDLGFRVYA